MPYVCVCGGGGAISYGNIRDSGSILFHFLLLIALQNQSLYCTYFSCTIMIVFTVTGG